MTKFLRKNSRIVLAVFGVFLLLTWLVGGVQSRMARNANKVVEGTLQGKKVYNTDLVQAAQEFDALKRVTPDLVDALGVKDYVHWYLLSTEAQHESLVGNGADGEAWLPDLARSGARSYLAMQVMEKYRSQPAIYRFLQQNPQMLGNMVDGEMRNAPNGGADLLRQAEEGMGVMLERMRKSAAGETRLGDEGVNLALAKLRGVQRMVVAYRAAARLSDKRLLAVGRERFDRLQADVLVVNASQFVDKTKVPPDAVLTAQFEKYRDVKPGEGSNGFGYYQPNRVKLEWIKLDKGVIEGVMTIDPIAANMHWQQNRATFPGDFATEKDRVVSALKAQRVGEVMSEAERAYKARLRAETRSLTNDGGVKRLPDAWQMPAMDVFASAIVEGVKASGKGEVPMPVVERRTDNWVRIDDADALPGIGGAGFSIGTRELGLSELLSNTAELGGKVELGLQTKVPFEGVLADNVGNRYVLRVVDAKKPSAPSDLGEVRSQVVDDVQRLQAFEKLAPRADEFQIKAASDGMMALATQLTGEALDKSVAFTVQPDKFFSREASDPASKDSKDGTLRKALFERAAALGMLTPATPENQILRTVGAAIPENLCVTITQLTGIVPLTQEALRGVRNNTTDTLAIEELAKSKAQDPYSYESLKARLDFVPSAERAKRTEAATKAAEEKPGQASAK